LFRAVATAMCAVDSPCFELTRFVIILFRIVPRMDEVFIVSIISAHSMRRPKMHRECPRCHRRFRTTDLAREESQNMETERTAAGLEGVRFLYYHCPACGADNIFVDILPRDGEPEGEFDARRAEMEAVVRGLHADHVGAVVVPVRTS
jgi:hypothetical protein